MRNLLATLAVALLLTPAVLKADESKPMDNGSAPAASTPAPAAAPKPADKNATQGKKHSKKHKEAAKKPAAQTEVK